MESYLEIVEKVLTKGKHKKNRTGTETLSIPGTMFQHDMNKGYPLLTTKYIPLYLIASELEFFIKGKTDKNWLQERGNNIWNQWCSPTVVPYGIDDDTKSKMKIEKELGPIYGWQWRHWGGYYFGCNDNTSINKGNGIDQLAELIHTIKTNPENRRMLVMAWNPSDLRFMALPPCHYGFQVTIIDKELHLLWNQRSVDVALGLPFNIASYALLLILLCAETGYKPGTLTGFLGDTHIYVNHIDKLNEQLTRKQHPLPTVKITGDDFCLLDWVCDDYVLTGYKHEKAIKFEIAV